MASRASFNRAHPRKADGTFKVKRNPARRARRRASTRRRRATTTRRRRS